MNRIKVNFESPSTRCEICHQADLFDPQTNCCSRCDSLNDEVIGTRKLPIDYGNIGLVCGLICGALCGLLWEKCKFYLPSNFPLSNSSSTGSLCWVMVGLAIIGAVWGNMVAEGVNLLLTRKGYNVNNNFEKTSQSLAVRRIKR
jgi:hypothetical protein